MNIFTWISIFQFEILDNSGSFNIHGIYIRLQFRSYCISNAGTKLTTTTDLIRNKTFIQKHLHRHSAGSIDNN